jgi:hypothetical protein
VRPKKAAKKKVVTCKEVIEDANLESSPKSIDSSSAIEEIKMEVEAPIEQDSSA